MILFQAITRTLSEGGKNSVTPAPYVKALQYKLHSDDMKLCTDNENRIPQDSQIAKSTKHCRT